MISYRAVSSSPIARYGRLARRATIAASSLLYLVRVPFQKRTEGCCRSALSDLLFAVCLVHGLGMLRTGSRLRCVSKSDIDG